MVTLDNLGITVNECILTHMEEKHLLWCDIMWPSPCIYACTYPAATQKGVAGLCLFYVNELQCT